MDSSGVIAKPPVTNPDSLNNNDILHNSTDNNVYKVENLNLEFKCSSFASFIQNSVL